MSTIQIPKKFEPYLDAALVRFQYLYPETIVSLSALELTLTNEASLETKLKEEFLHLLYKEKIYSETLDIRRSLYQAISS